MDLDRARDFVRTHHRAVLATTREDGTPQMSPVLAAVDDEGRIVVSSRQPAMKTHNLRRRPQAWVLVLSDGFHGDWVQIEGGVEVVELPGAMDGLVAYYRQISGDTRTGTSTARRCSASGAAARIDPSRAGPHREG